MDSTRLSFSAAAGEEMLRSMSHPNVELASELMKCVKASDVESVELSAVSGKRKGYLLLDQSTKRYVLTSKGSDFVRKWTPRHVQQSEPAQRKN